MKSMSKIKEQLKYLENMLDNLRVELTRVCPHVQKKSDIESVLHKVEQEYEILSEKSEQIHACIKKHPLIQKIKKQSKDQIKNIPALTLMQAQNYIASKYGYKNWNDVNERLFIELENYLNEDNFSEKDNHKSINIGKTHYGVACYLSQKHWQAHMALIDCASLFEKLENCETSILIINSDIDNEKTYSSFADSQKIINLNQWSATGCVIINTQPVDIKEQIRIYLKNKNHSRHEIWLIDTTQDIIEPHVLAQIRSYNIHLVFNYPTLAKLAHSEIIANNISTKIFNAQSHNINILSDIFQCKRPEYIIPSDKTKFAIIYQHKITELT